MNVQYLLFHHFKLFCCFPYFFCEYFQFFFQHRFCFSSILIFHLFVCFIFSYKCCILLNEMHRNHWISTERHDFYIFCNKYSFFIYVFFLLISWNMLNIFTILNWCTHRSIMYVIISVFPFFCINIWAAEIFVFYKNYWNDSGVLKRLEKLVFEDKIISFWYNCMLHKFTHAPSTGRLQLQT